MALKNAWLGAVIASDAVKSLEPAITALDLETCHRFVLAQANAVMALRGLIEQLQRKKETT